MSEQAVLVCALADSPRVVPGSVFHHHCAVCGRSVMVAPSGQRILAKLPCTIVCGECFQHMPSASVEAAGSIEEVLDEAARSQPNLRRGRN
jgi:hypothetical protein